MLLQTRVSIRTIGSRLPLQPVYGLGSGFSAIEESAKTFGEKGDIHASAKPPTRPTGVSKGF
jgi:hypothetical protein